MKVRIYYHHTDCAGLVYYATYLKFLEEARTEFLEKRGISIKELIKQGTPFVVARQEIDYKSPAFYADTLDIDTRLSNISTMRIGFEYEIKNQNGKTICVASTVMACVGGDFKPKAIPDEIKKKLS
jgi:acyl-CoA thioester hydrolase